MDFKKLRTFQCAANTLNFSLASNELGYVQSAVTNQIKALEDELKVKLFERNGRGVQLTPSGQELLKYTEKLMCLREEAKLAVSHRDADSPIRIGGHETVITYYLPDLISSYRKIEPNIRFSIQSTPVSQIKNDLLSGKLDVAFILEKPFKRSGLYCHTYKDEQIVVVCSPENGLAKNAIIEPQALRHEPLLLTETGCCYRNQFERILIEAGAYNVQQVSEFISLETIKQCVKLNMGVAALSFAAAKDSLADGSLVALNIEGITMTSNIHMSFNEDRLMPQYLRLFLDFCLEFDLLKK